MWQLTLSYIILPYDLMGGLDMSLLKQRHNGNAMDAKVLTAYPSCGGLQNMGSVVTRRSLSSKSLAT